MKEFKLAILGGGNIGTSLAKGLIASKQFSYEEILISEKREPRTEHLKSLGFHVTDNNHDAVSRSEIFVMSVKPQQFRTLADEIKNSVTSEHIIISTISGITCAEMESILGEVPIFRVMPNIAVEICESMTCISFRNSESRDEERVLSIFDQMGKTIIIPEEMMEAATVIGACGIAFALRFIRAMSQGGIETGFDSEMSQLITAQTVKGASGLIIKTGNHPEREIDRVTTPQGITISGLNEMEHRGMSSAIIRGLITSFNKLENLVQKSQLQEYKKV